MGEIPKLKRDDPKCYNWRPGEWKNEVDNVDDEGQLWGGLKQWEGEEKPPGYECPEWAQKIFDVPYMPGQPLKELMAREKARDPRPSEDKFHKDKSYSMPEGWEYNLYGARLIEKFGIHTLSDMGEWEGQEADCIPEAHCAFLHESQTDTVTILVGAGWFKTKNETEEGKNDGDVPEVPEVEGAEYDFLEYLYAKDQEGKCIFIERFISPGITKDPLAACFHFVPPKGTSKVTPYACFKIRGAWRGETIEWNSGIENEEYKWFTEMKPEMRKILADYDKLEPENKKKVDEIKYPKTRKKQPVLWGENSYEGNLLKAKQSMGQK